MYVDIKRRFYAALFGTTNPERKFKKNMTHSCIERQLQFSNYSFGSSYKYFSFAVQPESSESKNKTWFEFHAKPVMKLRQ